MCKQHLRACVSSALACTGHPAPVLRPTSSEKNPLNCRGSPSPFACQHMPQVRSAAAQGVQHRWVDENAPIRVSPIRDGPPPPAASAPAVLTNPCRDPAASQPGAPASGASWRAEAAGVAHIKSSGAPGGNHSSSKVGGGSGRGPGMGLAGCGSGGAAAAGAEETAAPGQRVLGKRPADQVVGEKRRRGRPLKRVAPVRSRPAVSRGTACAVARKAVCSAGQT